MTRTLSYARERPGSGHATATWLLAASAFTAGWLVLAWPWLSGRVTVPWDAKAHFLPQLQFMAKSFAAGDSPAWNPYVFSGHPQIADPQALLFSPPMVVLALIDAAPDGWTMDAGVYVTILLSGLALIAWFRDRGWHPAGAVLAALVFGFGAAMAWRIQHVGQVLSLAYLPLILLLLDRALDTAGATAPGTGRRGPGTAPARSLLPRVLYGVGAGAAAAAMVLGRDQVALLAVYFLIAYALWRILDGPASLWSNLVRALPPLAAGGLVGAALVALPILMTALMADGSNRPEIDYLSAAAGSLHPALFATLIAPDVFGSTGPMADYWGPPSFAWEGTGLFIAQNMGQLYIGLVPLIAIAYALLRGWLFARAVAPFAIAALLVTFYALGWFTPVFALAHTLLPGIDFYRRPADAVFLFGLFAAVVSGYALGRWLDDPDARAVDRPLALVAVAVAPGFAVLVALAWNFGRLEQATPALLISGVLALAAFLVVAVAFHVNPIRPGLAVTILTAFTVADIALQNGPGGATALPPGEYAVLDPASRTFAALDRASVHDATRRDRVELAGLGFHWGNASMTHGLEQTLGYNPVRLSLTTRATGASDLVMTPADRKFTPLFPGYDSLLADMLGLRFVVWPAGFEDARLAKGLSKAGEADGLAIWENADAHPRVRLVPNAAAADFDAILETGRWPGGFDPASTVLVEASDRVAHEAANAGPDANAGPPGAARIIAYRNTHIEVETSAVAPAWLLVNDVWHPWWRATIDSEPAAIHRANVLFRAVRVPAGTHRVTFTFAPVAGALAQARERLYKRPAAAGP